MAQILSVEMRHRGGLDFEGHYNDMCALQSSCPLPDVKMHLTQNRLDLNADRIRSNDFVPIISTIKINKSLESIAFHSYFQQTVEEQEERCYTTKRKIPAIRSKEISHRLCRALQSCLQESPKLKNLALEGLHLRPRDIQSLAKGIHESKSLEHLSLQHTNIGDEGLESIVKGLKNCNSLSTLNFTGCGLGAVGTENIAKLIRFQAIQRHNDAWRDSLRYRIPELDRMAGVRRITLNSNPLIGDEGLAHLSDALMDDRWLKAMDLQQCGATDRGAKTFLDVLQYNTCLVIVDLRFNPLIGEELQAEIMKHVMVNSEGQTEYDWIQPPVESKVKQRKRKTKTLPSNFGKKTSIKVSGSGSRSRNGTPSRTLTPFYSKPGTPGMPWRTALRANRCKGYPPDVPGSPGMSDPKYRIEYSTDEELDTKASVKTEKPVKELQVELEDLRRRYEEERHARAQSDKSIVELTVANNQLQRQVKEGGLSSEDLKNIEVTFLRFHAFLNMLEQAGLGNLISLARLDHVTSSPFIKKSADKSKPPRPVPRQQAPPTNGKKPAPTHHPAVDPVMGGRDNQLSSRPVGSKFDQLYFKVLAETEGALAINSAHSVGAGGDNQHNGLYSRGTTEKGTRLTVGREDGSSEASKGSSKTSSKGGPMCVDDLMDVADLAPAQSDDYGLDSAFSSPRHHQPSEQASQQNYNYSETFEHSPSEITTEDLGHDYSDSQIM